MKSRFWQVVFLLLVGLLSLRYVPFASRPGASSGVDFYNLHTYTNCQDLDKAYSGDSQICGDERGMVYPPIMLQLFFWTKGLPFDSALFIWRGFVLVGLVASGFFWIQTHFQFWKALLLVSLVSLQFSGIYALERGNNDVFILVVWTFATLLFYKRQLFLSGVLMSLAVTLKVYPLAAVGALGLFFLSQLGLRQAFVLRRTWFFGLVVGFIGLFLLHLDDNLLYYFKVLPAWAEFKAPGDFSQHGLQGKFFGQFGIFVGLSVVGFWVVYLRRSLLDLESQTLPFAFALAISTYFPGTANDYSLVCSIPLMLLLLQFAIRHPRESSFLLLTGAVLLLHSWYFVLYNPMFKIDSLKVPMHMAVFLIVAWIISNTAGQVSNQNGIRSHVS